jgi:phosphatidylethanolamine-binding protein (PEBP) family uncharacterized protein
MQVSYPTSTNKKTNFSQQETSSEPTIRITNPDGQYTLLMIDPDAGKLGKNNASPGNTKGLYYLHWLVVNIPSSGNVEEGDVLVPYAGPTPPAGTGQHRYIFILYKQKVGIVSGMNIQQRSSWNLQQFLQGKELTEVARQTIRVPQQKLNGNS